MTQMTFDPYEWAHARSTDPETSHEAAQSQKAHALRKLRMQVYRCLKVSGPMTDTDLVAAVQADYQRKASPSGIRTRRKELVEMDLVEDTGRRVVLPSGRKSIMWAVTDIGAGPSALASTT